MKTVPRLLTAILFAIKLPAQQTDPVHWKFSTRAIDEQTYEVNFTATVDPPWHIYAQDNKRDLTLPTTFKYTRNPLLEPLGSVKESGNMKQEKDGTSATVIRYYEDQVTFIQRVKLKAKGKTSFIGKIDYMACTGGRCLPPAQRSFSVRVGE